MKKGGSNMRSIKKIVYKLTHPHTKGEKANTFFSGSKENNKKDRVQQNELFNDIKNTRVIKVKNKPTPEENKKKHQTFEYEILESGSYYVNEKEMKKSVRQEDLKELRSFFNDLQNTRKKKRSAS
ncbi:hypothetical protein RSO41_07150 [Halomonas sp. I1]|uniref:hypothetical protein n=1 Tax=Halomonas sp. I1 TaxID=393536 RepID=UPI0028DDC440|nr:hypothetical protein [Halomonas sp. I1]MDT8894431.1 hypothetical protein [Halomonas sp. I1]